MRDVSQYDDINDLYLVSDMLLTDYSSVFFDYANLMRPMLFYMYDYENYKNPAQGTSTLTLQSCQGRDHRGKRDFRRYPKALEGLFL